MVRRLFASQRLPLQLLLLLQSCPTRPLCQLEGLRPSTLGGLRHQTYRNGIKFYRKVNGINFADDLLILNKGLFGEFAQEYKRTIGLPYTCNGRVEHFSDEIIASLKESGCTAVGIGVESGSEWLRKHILNRHHSNQQIASFFASVKQTGITSMISFLDQAAYGRDPDP